MPSERYSHFVLQAKRARLSLGSVTSLLGGLLGGGGSGGSGGSGGGSGGSSGSAPADAYPFRIILRHSNGRVRRARSSVHPVP